LFFLFQEKYEKKGTKAGLEKSKENEDKLKSELAEKKEELTKLKLRISKVIIFFFGFC